MMFCTRSISTYLYLQLSQAERNFYEALRQQALENIENDRDQAVRQIRILAEIMRLRRACCHPKLVDESTETSSSKEQAFSDLVDELVGGGHRALVFSQFTGHLALLRQHLDGRGIRYCYLDGSTAAAQRERQVKAFQSGAAPLFLISLKAGGLGLNLTAADYVIHMDPWWNPAVEDQAADRAHRITMIAIWLGNIISEYGIQQQGLSLIIFSGIVSQVPLNLVRILADLSTG